MAYVFWTQNLSLPIVPTLSRSYRHFLDHPDTTRSSGRFAYYLDIASRRFPNYPEILQPIMNLSGFAMLPCYKGYSNSADFLGSY